MEIIGTIKLVLEPETGEGRNGQWKKQQFVIETDSEYSKSLCFTVWGDKVDFTTINIGDKVKVLFDVESREYNGRWFTDAKAWKAEKLNQENGFVPPEPKMPDENFEAEEGDDLPF
jgi:hypothetical protein